ncbi:MAG: hypothetical protein J0H65_15715 [Rhizobiales bacterium]|nr:hypothetical protein [Hyphomicrobiales bacterium]
MTIGTHGAPWTAETARKRAEQLIGDIAGGGDPAEAKRQERARATVAEASALFLAHHGPKLKPRTREEYERLFRAQGYKRTEDWYSVLTHELGHWSGAEKRLNRDLRNRFGDEAYAMEELVALSGRSGRGLSGQSQATRVFS